MFPTILVVDDEPAILQSLSGILMDEGFEVVTAANGYEALKTIDAESPDLVLLDIWMPGIDGIETLKAIKKDNPFIQVIIITGHGTIETAVKATKLGAFDFIEKPLSIDKIVVSINNALNFRRLEEENKYLRKKSIEKNSLTGNSGAIMDIKKQIAVTAPTDAWVLISGENGAGKELVARTIHKLSPRTDQPMINVNCAAIPEDSITSELFGHEKGAFTGATIKYRGKFELANKGTLFFDEIGDMSLKTQARILRVLQEQKFHRVGGSRILNVDIRVVASTNKDLEQEIAKGLFREELYYRINVIPIMVPPLRERSDDIPLLVETFLTQTAEQSRSKVKKLTVRALEQLKQYTWPGNVRELKNLLERLVIMAPKNVIDVSDLPGAYCDQVNDLNCHLEPRCFEIDSFKDAQKKFESEYMRMKLLHYNNDIGMTAKALNIEPDYIKLTLKI